MVQYPPWLRGMEAPTFRLWFFLFAVAFASAATCAAGEVPVLADLALRIVWPMIVATWVVADARKQGRSLCYDYGTFVFLAWPVLVPIYLFQTRGWRAFYTFLCLAGMAIVYVVLTTLLRWFLERG